MKPDLSMTIEQARKLVEQLKAENDPSNNELIAFYEDKISKAVDKAYEKAFKRIANKAFSK
jgi:hypothetical protein